MYPKTVPADFTPFPLPKHDETLGFGPVRLHNVPDVEEAKQRMAAAAAAARTGRRPTTVMEEREEEESAESLAASMMWDDAVQEDAAARGAAVAPVVTGSSNDTAVSAVHVEESSGDLRGYHAHAQFPLLDVLECDRSVEDLLSQFYSRPHLEARAATVQDFAATLQRRTNDELTRILYELSSLFTHDGSNLPFFFQNVAKFGRSYVVTNALLQAFIQLLDAMTVAFVEEQPQRLAESPALFAQVLHFLALVKVMEPNRWFSVTANAMQNRADYSHARGVNRTTSHKGTGQVLVEFLEDVVAAGHEVETEEVEGDSAQGAGAAAATGITAAWSPEEILDVLAGFAGVMPDGKAPSPVVAALLDALWHRWSEVDFVLTTPQQADQLERLYLLLQMMDAQRDAVLDALLGGQLRASSQTSAATLFREREDTPPLTLSAALTGVRGPDFFAAVSKDRRAEVRAMALQVLDASLAKARAQQDEALLQALVESGTELLQTVRDKEVARTFALQKDFDDTMLRAVPHMANVAARLRTQGSASWTVFPLTRSVQGGLPDTKAVLAHLRAHPVPYVTMFEGRRVHPVRTFVANLDFIKSMDSVFILHSSGVESHVMGLVSVVRRLRSGKDALLITSSCLRSLQAVVSYGPTEKVRARADRALTIIAYELEAGRAVLLPVSEELYLHDAGTYCDEDLMLWTLAAYLARDLPLVKVHTIISRRSTARNPHHFLHADMNPAASTSDIYNPSTPLLQSLRSKELRSMTHHPLLLRPVSDRKSKMFNVNPNRAGFLYRRDKALFDKYHVTARHVAPGFSQGALASDLRGLGFYTPDHPQVPYSPVGELMARPVQP